MTIADTEEPVSWLKQNPNRQSFASKPTYNKRISTMATAAVAHGHGHQEILPKDRRPVSPPWSNPPTANDRVSSMIMAPSPTPSTASSTPTSALRKADGNVQQFIPRLDLDLSPMTIHPRDTEDEEDENEDGDSSSGLQSPTSIQYVSNDLMGRVQSLESELQTAYQHVHYLKAQLAQHDQSTQALVTKHIEEKESEKLRVKQLTELVHTQDLLIQQLQQRQQQPATSSSDSSMAQELSKLRADLDTLHFEKRSLETRMAAFLHEELDMSHVSLLSNDDDELFSVAMGYRSSTEQQPQDLLQHMDLRRRSSSIIDADQYSMMTFGNASSHHHHRSNSNSENRLCSPMGHITSNNNNNNHATSPSSRYTNHSTLNLVEERDEEDDAVSRYSSLSSSPATMSFASPTSSSSASDPRYSILKSTQQMRTSLSSVSSSHLPAHAGSPTTTSPSTAAAAANAARKAAWARIMIPPATPPPSHPLPPLPPNGGAFPLPADDTLDDDSDMDDAYPDPRQSHSPRKSMMPHPPSVPPLAISTSSTSISQQQQQQHDPGLSSAPPIMSPQRESLEAALQKNGRESAATVHSSGTDETSSRESKQSFWKGVKTKWKRK